MDSMTTRQLIDDFLGQRRLAMAGVSRSRADFSRMLLREFLKRGYDMVPVNPQATEIEGLRCFARVPEIDPPVDGVLLMTPPGVIESVVRDCAEASVTRVWMHRAVGPGAMSQNAVDLCAQRGIRVVAGYCPMMFLRETGFPHRLHGFLLKLIGRYPR